MLAEIEIGLSGIPSESHWSSTSESRRPLTRNEWPPRGKGIVHSWAPCQDRAGQEMLGLFELYAKVALHSLTGVTRLPLLLLDQ